jgi:hypothetical protein
LGLHSHLPLHSPAKGKEVKPLKRMANGKAGSFAFAFAICHLPIRFSELANGKANAFACGECIGECNVLPFASANGKWRMQTLV